VIVDKKRRRPDMVGKNPLISYQKSRHSLKIIWNTLLCMLLLYILGFFVLFDTSKPAYIYDEEVRNGKNVVAGPLPRFENPPYHQYFYVGNEKIFILYKPFCRYWSVKNGYTFWGDP
jgi:hypothetical protein